MDKLLKFEDYAWIAKDAHKSLDGTVGLVPIFAVVMLANERMGIARHPRWAEIMHICQYRSQERNIGTEELTNDAIAYTTLIDGQNFYPVMEKVEELIRAARAT